MDGRPRLRLRIIVCRVAAPACALLVGCVTHNLPDDLASTAVEEAAAAPVPVAQVPVSPYARGTAQPWAGDDNTVAPAAGVNGQPQSNFGGPRTAADPAALQAAVAELQALGDIDAATQSRLIADLQQTDPSLWPLLLQTFKAGAAYRRKEAGGAATTQVAAAEPAKEPRTPVATAAPSTATQPVTQASFTEAATTDQLPLEAMAAQLAGAQSGAPQLAGRGGGGQFPTQAILAAALAEAQRREAEARQAPAAAAPPAPVTAAAAKTELQETPAAETKTPTAATDDWRQALDQSIAALERSTTEPPTSAQEVSRHAWLRMLYLTAGRRDDALKPIPGISAAEQDFWREQLYALATCLDTERQTDAAKRSAEARVHLAKADSRLGETGTLAVRNLAFCTEVSSFGVYEKFDEYRFKANEPLILYAEVQNFKSEESPKGFHTALRSSYQILDAQGRRVAENDLALTEEYCRNERRDYFLRYFLAVPERIYDGNYTLQLTIVDTLSQKIGTATIDFTVGGKK